MTAPDQQLYAPSLADIAIQTALMENARRTAAFKIHGAYNRIRQLDTNHKIDFNGNIIAATYCAALKVAQNVKA